MPEIETGLLSIAPKGYILAGDEEKFGGNTRIFAITNMRGWVVTKWANAATTRDAKQSFICWFKNQYPGVNPPFRGNVFIFRKREGPAT